MFTLPIRLAAAGSLIPSSLSGVRASASARSGNHPTSQRHDIGFTLRISQSRRRFTSTKSNFQTPHTRPSERASTLSEVWYYLKLGTGTLLGVHIFLEYFYTLEWTWGISMLPTLAADGDGVIISKYYRHGRGVQVGDLVSFKHPMDEHMRALKRVLAMPGDFVMRDSPHKGKAVMVQIPDGHCYVVGDNLQHSRDSRMFGPLPLGLIVGKAVCKVTAPYYIPWPSRIAGGLSEPEADVDPSLG